MADPAVGNAEIFDPSKEKKKKKKKALDLDAVLSGTASVAAVEEDRARGQDGIVGVVDEAGEGEEAFDDILESLADFGGKKKKKKAKKVEIDDVALEDIVAVVTGVGGEEESLDFGKKKKKKVKAAIGLDDLVADGDVGGDDTIFVDTVESVSIVITPGDDDNPEGEDGERAIASADDDDPSATNDIQFNDEDGSPTKENEVVVVAPIVKTWLSSDRDYTYDELLDRVFEIMRAKNPEMVSGTKQKFVMRPPQVVRIGTKKTSFVNFMEICKMLHRHQKHLLDFLLSELGTSGSIDGNNQLIIKGRFQQKQIENVLRRYIKEYVTCHTCRSPNTLLQKDFRLFFLQCEACGSRCSVASIKHGFQAQVSKRAAMRAKAN